MKARHYSRSILNAKTTCHVYAIQESNCINRSQLNYFGADMSEMEKNTAILQIQGLLDVFIDAKEYGSILKVNRCDWQLLYKFVENVDISGQMTMDTIGAEDTKEQLHLLVEIGEVMAQKYDVVVTNPPYMGKRNYNKAIRDLIFEKYNVAKHDLFAVFLISCIDFSKEAGYVGMMTPNVWMYISRFEEVRRDIVSNYTIKSIIRLEESSFLDATVSICSFIIRKIKILKFVGNYISLEDFRGAELQPSKTREAITNHDCSYIYKICLQDFLNIPKCPLSFTYSHNVVSVFQRGRRFGEFFVSESLNLTGDNEKYLRNTWEVNANKIGINSKWLFYAKGGRFRKWYGNIEDLISWSPEARAFYKSDKIARIIPEYLWYREGITWSFFTSRSHTFRYLPDNATFDIGGASIFFDDFTYYFYFMGLLNSIVGETIFELLNPTVNLQVADVSELPVIIDNNKKVRIDKLVRDCIEISKKDWDSFETSWDFKKHPFLNNTSETAEVFDLWQKYTENQFNQLKANQEELNCMFIIIYSLQDELTPEVQDKDVTVHRADLEWDIRSLVSYAVGCMFGRYSLDNEGLVYAGGEWDGSKYSTFIPDKDNILPITDEEYFEDDVVGLFCAFLKKTFGADALEENLDFIAKALGNKGNSSREIIRNYFIKDFFKDHCKIYQKKPIYWMFDSGKADGFKALIYMHRYNEDTIGNLRIDYLHRMQRVYESEISSMQETINNSIDAREVSAATKRKEKLVKQLKETKEYDEKIAHLALARIAIDLDDGVKVNYEKVQIGTDGKKLEVLAKI